MLIFAYLPGVKGDYEIRCATIKLLLERFWWSLLASERGGLQARRPRAGTKPDLVGDIFPPGFIFYTPGRSDLWKLQTGA